MRPNPRDHYSLGFPSVKKEKAVLEEL